MLVIGKRKAKEYSSRPQLVAYDRNDKKIEIFVVPWNSVPGIQTSDPWSLVSKEFLHKTKKRYTLTKTQLKKLRKAYIDKAELIENEDASLENELAISSIENYILDKLRTIYGPKMGVRLIPYYPLEKGDKTATFTVIAGSSGTGKTWLLTKELLQEPGFEKREVIVFSPHNRTDKAVLEFVQSRPKNKTHLVDLKLLEKDEAVLSLDDIPEGAICCFDDIESLSGMTGRGAKGYSLRRMIFNLMNQIFTSGRHKNVNPAFVIVHNLNLGWELRTIKNEATRFIFLHKFSNKNHFESFMKSKLHLSISRIKEIWKNARNSRWIAIYASPPVIVSEKHVELYDS